MTVSDCGGGVDVSVGVSVAVGVAVAVTDGVRVHVGGSTTGPAVRVGGAGVLSTIVVGMKAVGTAGPPVKSGLVRTQYAPPATTAKATTSRMSRTTI